MKKIWLFIIAILAFSIVPFHLQAPATENQEMTIDDGAGGAETHLGENADPGIWRVSMKARIASNYGHTLALLLENPQNMKIQEEDRPGNIALIPVTTASAALDEYANPVELTALQPGQEVRATFLYTWEGTGPRSPRMLELEEVVCLGEQLRVEQYVSVDNFKEDVIVGTILQAEETRFRIFIDSARLLRDGYEYPIAGAYWFEVTDETVIRSADGMSLQSAALPPFQRVVIDRHSCTWSEGAPPQLAGGVAHRVQVLQMGEKAFQVQELAGLHRFIATVSAVGTDPVGNDTVTVVPEENSRYRKYQSEYILTLAPGTAAGAYRGKQVLVYVGGGVDLLSSPGRIPYAWIE